MRALGLAVLLLAGGCGGQMEVPASTDELETALTEPGPLMRPGDNCLRCHNPQGQASAKPWTAAGTVFPVADAGRDQGLEGALVKLTSVDGQTVTLVTNRVGNFYTDAALGEGFKVELEWEGRSIAMSSPPPAGSCNACHSLPPVGGAPGRIRVP
ncbi:MAG: hypothetical protein ACOZIN_01475 [Myxococcota bacterium]